MDAGGNFSHLYTSRVDSITEFLQQTHSISFATAFVKVFGLNVDQVIVKIMFSFPAEADDTRFCTQTFCSPPPLNHFPPSTAVHFYIPYRESLFDKWHLICTRMTYASVCGCIAIRRSCKYCVQISAVTEQTYWLEFHSLIDIGVKWSLLFIFDFNGIFDWNFD